MTTGNENIKFLLISHYRNLFSDSFIANDDFFLRDVWYLGGVFDQLFRKKVLLPREVRWILF